MLKLRILSALVAAPLVVAAILLLPLPALAVVFLVLAALGLVEWARLARIEGAAWGVLYVAGLTGVAAASWWLPAIRAPLLLAGCLAWAFAVAVVLRFPASAGWLPRGLLVPGGWLLLGAAWLGLVVVAAEPQGRWLLLWLFVLVWGADIGAYFAGRAFGRRKLAPAVSPGKTWEGVVGGALVAIAAGFALVAGTPLAMLGWHPLAWLALMAALTAVSVFGDLFESALKRMRGIKDSGTLIPGHGGVLDRIDSLLAVLPVFGAIVRVL